MMRLTALLALLLFTLPSSAQTGVRDSADEMPQMIGGIAAVQEHVHYPESARREGVEGRVVVGFVVDEEGNVVNAEVLRGVGSGLDEAAVAAIEQVRFTPGRTDGQPVKVRMALPIVFHLSETEDVDDGTEGSGAVVVDEMPTIIGGLGALVDRIEYPEEAEARGIEGRVVVSFMVTEEGEVEDAAVADSAHPLLDEAAVDAVEGLRFEPGRKAGQPVAVRMALPVTFALPDIED